MTTEKKRQCKFPGCYTNLYSTHEGEYCHVHEEDGPYLEELASKMGLRQDTQVNTFMTVKEYAKEKRYSERTIREKLKTKRIFGIKLPKSRKWLIPSSQNELIDREGLEQAEGDVDNPIYECIREHIPSISFWQNHAKWAEKNNQYIESCQKLIRDFISDEQVIISMNKHPSFDDESFYQPLLWSLEELSLGQELSIILEQPIEHTEKKPVSRIRKETITVKEVHIVMPGHILRFLNTTSAEEVMSLFKEAKSLENEFRITLQKILIRRDYIAHSCSLCPGTASES